MAAGTQRRRHPWNLSRRSALITRPAGPHRSIAETGCIGLREGMSARQRQWSLSFRAPMTDVDTKQKLDQWACTT